jgi:hypothetical protein
VSGEKDGWDQQRNGDPEEIHAAISATKIFQDSTVKTCASNEPPSTTVF